MNAAPQRQPPASYGHENKNMSVQLNKKNQHWVPRFYLKHFAVPETASDKNPKAWAWCVNDADSILTGINGLCSSRYLYSPKDKNGVRDWHTEDKLASFESDMSIIWPHFVNEMFDFYRWEAVRKSVALFISLLILRHPENLDNTKNIHRNMVSFYDSFPKDDQGNPRISNFEFKGKQIPFDASNFEEYKHATENVLQKLFVDNINNHAIEVANLLLAKRWSVLLSEQSSFFTCDKPVIVENGSEIQAGIMSPDVLIMFPICPTKLLLLDDMHDQPQGQYYPLKESDPSPFNMLLVRNAVKFVISPRKIDVEKDIFKWVKKYETQKKLWGNIFDFLYDIKFTFKRAFGWFTKFLRK